MKNLKIEYIQPCIVSNMALIQHLVYRGQCKRKNFLTAIDNNDFISNIIGIGVGILTM
jgi:hypothetical protein